MTDYQRDQQQTIPVEQVKIIGIGGAGANMLDRIALDGTDAASMLALNTDSRTLATGMAGEKVQMGMKLTMGLGAGGDPEVGLKAAQEAETEIRDALRNQKIVFICVGLGGGTGSGAVPLVTRIAREQGAFVVVFATMPFEFEGKRRKQQAETALNELSVLSNALVTFENGKMGELVLASQGIHEAFSAADVMISQSIKAVTRLVVQPGIINVGLDDLITALKATKSRCLFGSGIAEGENRSHQALKNALGSPLLDKGSLLKSATSVVVHICGGKGMSLYEVELLMRELGKNIPEDAHVLFGAAVDDSMGEKLSVTLISALPENLLLNGNQEQEVKEEVAEEPKEEKKVEPVKQPEPETEAPKTEEKPKEGSIVSEATTDAGKVVLSSISTPKEEEPKEEKKPVKTPKPITSEILEQAKEIVAEEKEEKKAQPEPKQVDPEFQLEEPAQKKTEPVAMTALETEELPLDGGPKGKFSGEAPNVVDGEDLDIPPFLRNR